MYILYLLLVIMENKTPYKKFFGREAIRFADLALGRCRPSILSSSHMSFIAIPWWPINTHVAYLF